MKDAGAARNIRGTQEQGAAVQGHGVVRQPGGVRQPVHEARVRAARRDRAVRAAVEQGLLGPDAAVVGLLDVTGIRESAAALRAAFGAVVAPGTPVLHAFAVKACPLVPVVRLLHTAGLGAEVASPGELALARAAGCRPRGRCWTRRRRPRRSCARPSPSVSPSTRTTRRSWTGSTRWCAPSSRSPLGLRVNPQIGNGTIGATSTATRTSKFGVALRDEGRAPGSWRRTRGGRG
ncbi:hypothetical protein ACFQ3Z_19690 [Streptomyces nogalater]